MLSLRLSGLVSRADKNANRVIEGRVTRLEKIIGKVAYNFLYPPVDSADFDGTNDYMTRGAGLTGAADSKSGILSCWIRIDGGDGVVQRIFNSDIISGPGPAIFLFLRRGDNLIGIGGDNAAGTEILLLVTSNTYIAGTTWIHVLASWDLAATAGHLYINDVSDLGTTTLTNDTIKYTFTNWAIGAFVDGNVKFNGCIAELYFAPGQYLDFSSVNNRRKFISAGGKPVFLGTAGSRPTGIAPLVYHHLNNGEIVSNFAINHGTGGNFTITGTLDTGSSSPSD